MSPKMAGQLSQVRFVDRHQPDRRLGIGPCIRITDLF